MKEREALYLGALFHDIGKFIQRGSSGEDRFFPHQALSGSFVNEFFKDPVISFIAACHHTKDLNENAESGIRHILAEIVCEADSLSSGEREQAPDVKEQQPLQSIFSCIHDFADEYFQPVSPVTPENYAFPVKSKNLDELEKAYQKQLEKFRQELPLCRTDDDFTLFNLLKKYLWSIPSSSYRTKSDVSLFAHSKVTAAISVCLYEFLLQSCPRAEDFRDINNRDEKRYLLICGDLTGIQKYIYNIGHKGAARALKGRSFFLEQMMESAAHWLLSKEYLDLKEANLLYSSGGKLYILAPNTVKTNEAIERAACLLDEKLLGEYDGNISIVFAFTELTGSDFALSTKDKGIAAKWDEAGKKLEENKKKKFHSFLTKEFFEPFGPSGDVIRCFSTGKEICEAEKLFPLENVIENSGAQKFILYSSGYKNAYLITDDDEKSGSKFISEEQYISGKLGYKLRSDIGVIAKFPDAEFDIMGLDRLSFYSTKEFENTDVAAEEVTTLNSDDFLLFNQPLSRKGWKYYGGSWSPERDFDELADSMTIGVKYLAALKMDVDNLGLIFRSGLGNRATISRIVQMSEMLDFFFGCYINQLKNLYWDISQGLVPWPTAWPLKDLIQVVYSGGDDLFITGVWNVMPDVAFWINEKFRKFTCNNPAFSLSAAIELFDPKFPLYKAALKTGEELSRSKSLRQLKANRTASKNAITFLDNTVSWKDFAIISENAKQFYYWIDSGIEQEAGNGRTADKLKRAFINMLRNIYAEYRSQQEELWERWRWRAAYYLNRFSEQNKHFQSEIREVAFKLFKGEDTEEEYIKIINTAAIWADFLTRKEN